jgi:hypothetical protein
MMPITALDEKNMDKTKPSERRPLRGLLMKSVKKPINTELFFSPGITSLIRLYKLCSNSFDMGNKGINVNKKIIAGGMAITKLKAMDAALSWMPTVFTWPKKKLMTSNKGTPRKPGIEVALLFLTRKFARGEAEILFFISEKKFILFYWICFFG